MSSRKVRSLTRNLGQYRQVNARGDDSHQDFQLVRQETHLSNVSQVERFLPDILGRALARCWIDKRLPLARVGGGRTAEQGRLDVLGWTFLGDDSRGSEGPSMAAIGLSAVRGPSPMVWSVGLFGLL